MDKNIIENRIEKAVQGRDLWLDIIKQYNITSNSYVILFPDLDKDCNAAGLKYLNPFLNKKKADKAIILTSDDYIINNISKYSQISKAIFLSKEDLEKIMLFYCVHDFTDKLVILSLDEPFRRSGLNILKQKDTSIEEIVALCIYGLNTLKI